ncbi:hypothetical protein CLOM_g7533 [Closterium sp. NIES-68]|nr:hypothetical protein CLOM_g7533 [Closterium sp. NIES-68]GJP80358.1 hypothetical protein CLOP_g10567 [Closterium sp. NIES-67]
MADIFEQEEEAMTAEEYEERVEEALAVLGADDPDKCTYDMGYRKRQALYSCLTCVPPPKIPTLPKETEGSEGERGASSRVDLKDILSGDWNPAGICTACSLKCHDGHELVELYTKRRFCCDCGTSKFQGSVAPSCQLQPEKEPLNERNEYSQNYAGVYCNCRRPFPDPEAEARGEDEDMTQCIVCEDWFHDHHLGLEPGFEAPEHFTDLICGHCASTKCRFFKLYPHLLVAPESVSDAPSDGDGNKPKAVTNESDDVNGDDGPGSGVCGDVSEAACGHQAAEVVDAAISKQPGLPNGGGPDVSAGLGSAVAHSEADCKLASALGGQTIGSAFKRAIGESTSTANVEHPLADRDVADCSSNVVADAKAIADLAKAEFGPLFLTEGWRASICSCRQCTRFYEEQGVDFLVDVEDSIKFYEDEAKKIRQQKEEEANAQVEAQFQSMDRVAQLEIIHGLNTFKSDFAKFLEKHAGTDHVITAQDVQQFAEEQKAKRPRRL